MTPQSYEASISADAVARLKLPWSESDLVVDVSDLEYRFFTILALRELTRKLMSGMAPSATAMITDGPVLEL